MATTELLPTSKDKISSKAKFLENAKNLRRKHYAKASAYKKLSEYISLSYSWGIPLDFSDALKTVPKTLLLFEKKELPLSLTTEAIPVKIKGTPPKPTIQQIGDRAIAKVMGFLDFPSVHNFRLCSKELDTVYNDNREDICDAIVARTRNIIYVSDYLAPANSVKVDSEDKLLQHHYCIEWIVAAILPSFRDISEKYDKSLCAEGFAQELAKATGGYIPPKAKVQPEILRGPTYPLPALMAYLLEKHLGSKRRSKNNLPRYYKQLTKWERQTAMDQKEGERATWWTINLVRWHLAKDRILFYAINDHIAKAYGDEDLMIGKDEYCDFLRQLKPAQLWELVRLVGIKTDDKKDLTQARGFLGAGVDDVDAEEDGTDAQEEFILARVQKVLQPM
ncbi:hypothetical protein DRE_02604 [Drechslerella stenobrocha 248]|uniref:Uncharacterized protein n=1 Tax=Drechslerella stenobrocha 248 TaxID=1043628 RepID=W7IFV1_9PEZI|nr:hypothetical protein DRE_02604 [Drechslerella stenobrocha 248]